MTVESTTSTISYLYTGPGDYSYLFKAYLNSDIVVEHISTTGAITTLAESTDYTLLRAVADEGGTVTTTYAPTTGILRISRILPLTQSVALENQGPLDMETMEKALDRNVMILQQLQSDLDGATTASEWLGMWTTGTTYGIRDIVQATDGNWYTCLADHTAAALFATDLSAGYWLLVIDVSAVTDLKTVQAEDATMVVTYGATTIDLKVGTIDTANIGDESVTAAKIASFPDVVSRDIIGGDVTTSSQRITVSAFGCWDSTGTVWMETSSSPYWDVPATNNLEVYLFAVRATSGGAISVKGYSTYAGPASDGANVNAYRFISWAKNNGSGVLFQYVQFADEIAYTSVGTGSPLLASVGAGWGSVDISSIIPVSVVRKYTAGCASGSTIALGVSYDGGTTQAGGSNYSNPMSYILPKTPVHLISINGTGNYYIKQITLRR